MLPCLHALRFPVASATGMPGGDPLPQKHASQHDARQDAELDSMALKNAAYMTGAGGLTTATESATNEQITKILNRKGDKEYIAYMRTLKDYKTALVYLAAYILVQDSHPYLYEIQKKVVELMFHTADGKALLDLSQVLGSYDEGPNKFPNMLDHFQRFASRQGDTPMVGVVVQMLQSMLPPMLAAMQ